jgi:hypothetical protein
MLWFYTQPLNTTGLPADLFPNTRVSAYSTYIQICGTAISETQNKFSCNVRFILESRYTVCEINLNVIAPAHLAYNILLGHIFSFAQ